MCSKKSQEALPQSSRLSHIIWPAIKEDWRSYPGRAPSHPHSSIVINMCIQMATWKLLLSSACLHEFVSTGDGLSIGLDQCRCRVECMNCWQEVWWVFKSLHSWLKYAFKHGSLMVQFLLPHWMARYFLKYLYMFYFIMMMYTMTSGNNYLIGV